MPVSVTSTRCSVAAGLLLLLSLGGAPALATAAAADPAEIVDPLDLLRHIRSTSLDFAAAVSLRGVELELGLATLDIERGILIPARTRDGRIIELVFIGQARFRLEPPDEIEAGQLELFTGRDRMDAAVEEAVLVVADPGTVRKLLDRPLERELRPGLYDRAREVHRQWLFEPERRDTGVEAAIFKFLVGDEAFRNYFAIWGSSYELGDFVYQLDPEDVEQITLASFTPIDLHGWARKRLKRHIKIQQRKGRWMGVRLQDIGAWDIWLSTPWTPATGQPLPGDVGFEATHYDLDVQILRNATRLRGTARIDLTAEAGGRRVITLELYRDLDIKSVVDDRGRSLTSFRSGKDLLVYLPERSKAGERMTLEIAYEGRALKWVGPKTYDLEDTSNWYPHCGTVDRATYDVKLAWPKKYDLIAGGVLVESGRSDGRRWERRTLEVPAIAFSFVIGEFLIEKKKVGHVDLTMAFNRSATRSGRTPDEALETVGTALEYFEETFGRYPLDELTVVTLPRDYSQSYLGFVTLSDSFLRPENAGRGIDLDVLRDTTIAHEVAHQWWGNLVGWWSYRDQWLSEAMATYSSLLYHSHVLGEGAAYLADMSAGWREQLSQTTFDGRTIESLGPIVLGGRLASSLSGSAYNAIVYRKGAVVLAMLARSMGEAKFLAMLKSIIQAASNHVLTNENFLAALERMSGEDLQGFARQYVYGTGIPQVYYTYSSEEDGHGGWLVRGEARQLAEPRYTHRAVRQADGGWDVERETILDGVRPASIKVPFRITLGEDANERGGSSRVRDSRAGFLKIDERRSEFEIGTHTRPIELQIDPYGEILARFLSVELHPKRGARLRAQDQAVAGNFSRSEASYLQALAQRPELDGKRDALRPQLLVEAENEAEDIRIRLALARLYLDQGRRSESEAQLAQVEEAAVESVFRMEYEALSARLEVQNGDYPAAFKRLKKTLRLASPESGPRTWRRLLLQLRLKSARMAMTEAYLLFAIAALETSHEEELDWAIREGRERGVDVSLLEALAERGLVKSADEFGTAP